MDSVSPRRRSEIMSMVRSRDTKPELLVRHLVRAMGYRYRLHVKDLRGTPDLVFPRRRKVIFIHGCFWHRHSRCTLARLPKSRKSFWIPKLSANRSRDVRNRRALNRAGWHVLTVWECQLSHLDRLNNRIRSFLSAKH